MAKTKEMILNTAREKTESVFLSGENWNLKKKKNQLTSLQKLAGQKGVARYIQSLERETGNLGYCTQQDYHLEQSERERISQTSKN